MIPMELTSVYINHLLVFMKLRICIVINLFIANVKYKTKGHDYKKEVGDIDFFYYDERLHIVYEDEEYVTSYMILGIFLFLFGLRIIFVHIKEDMLNLMQKKIVGQYLQSFCSIMRT